MPRSRAGLEALRAEVTNATLRATDLIADLRAIADRFGTLVPDFVDRTEAERWTETAKLCGIDASMPDQLAQMIECLADALAGLTTSDGGRRWLEHQRARLATGEDAAA